MKNRNFFKIFFMVLVLFISTNVSAMAGDASGGGGGGGPQGGGDYGRGIDSEWLKTVSGIRVTVVDKNGVMVSERSIDYLTPESKTLLKQQTTIGTAISLPYGKKYSVKFYKCSGVKRNKLSYRYSRACDWTESNVITDDMKFPSWLAGRNLYNNSNSASYIREKILNMSRDELENNFLDDIGYDVSKNLLNLEEHYLIIEPLSLIKVAPIGGVPMWEYGYDYFYGTATELTDKIHYVTNDYDWIWHIGVHNLPFSIYVSGNNKIEGGGGYNPTNKTYFNGMIQVLDDKCYFAYKDCADDYIGWFPQYGVNGYGNFDENRNIQAHRRYGGGLGIFWFKDLEAFTDPEPVVCDYYNPSHFESSTSGPNGEECCFYVKDNLSTYGITEEEQLYQKYPRCRFVTGSCKVGIKQSHPTCSNNANGYIKDIDDWGCITASSYSSDPDWNEYFLQYPKRDEVATSDCAVYCRNEITYRYPGKDMITLAGTYFTISTGPSSFSTYIDPTTNETKINAATLGPVQVVLTRECTITGKKNNTTCKNKVTEALNNIKAPTIEFGYESKSYNNPTLTLASSVASSHENVNNNIYKRVVTYNYSLSNTYKYVSKKNGVSYKNNSEIGDQPYVTIGNHLPLEFAGSAYTTNYQLTIKKFNLPNFDKLVLNNNTVSTRFTNNIETYVKTLIDSGRATPRYINGLYYLDNTFVELLKKNSFSADNLIYSTCGNTGNYTCSSDGNGIKCLDKNSNSNSENTYVLFNACINNEAQKIKYEKENYKNDMLYSCNFDVKIYPGTPACYENSDNYCDPNCPNDPDCTNSKGSVYVIYRPISLDDPFPSIDADGRVTGANWCYGLDCNNKNSIVTSVITNNRGVTTEELYKDLDPLYTITLTPGLIKEIREYNDKNPYDDFELECNSNGFHCKSNFIRNQFKNYFSGCGIKSSGLRCSSNDQW